MEVEGKSFLEESHLGKAKVLEVGLGRERLQSNTEWKERRRQKGARRAPDCNVGLTRSPPAQGEAPEQEPLTRGVPSGQNPLGSHTRTVLSIETA